MPKKEVGSRRGRSKSCERKVKPSASSKRGLSKIRGLSSEQSANANGNSLMKSPAEKVKRTNLVEQTEDLSNFNNIMVTDTVDEQANLDLVQLGLDPNEEMEFDIEANRHCNETDQVSDDESLQGKTI